nr:aa3-type cytochrome c oxidase subunit IV [Sphingomonas sp. Y57]
MSDDHGAPMDYEGHNQTYSGFITLLKVGTIASALIGLLVVFLIAPKG